jgi:hypothetical protein
MATYCLPSPSFDQEPFFSWVFHTHIVAGSFFVFKTSQGKLQVARILEASKALLNGYDVKVNLFLPFDEWEITTRYPVANGLGKNLKEIVATHDVLTYNFDSQVHDIAFVFKETQLLEHGAVLQGIDNAYVCRYLRDDTEIGLLSPFPSLIRDVDGLPVSLVSPCFLSRVFHDIKRLRTRLYLDLNRRGELQGEYNRTYNAIPFSPESWAYFKIKLCARLGVQLPRPLKQRIFKYRLDEGMSKMKYQIPMESVELIRIETEADLVSLRCILGTTISYGIRNAPPTLNSRRATTIKENDTLNIVIASTDNAYGFTRVLPAKYGGFDFIFDGTSTLFVRTRYKKVLYRTNRGSCDPIVEAEGIPDHFQVMLKDAHWGYWKEGPPNSGNRSNIKVGDYFDDNGTMFEVLEVNATSVVAKLFLTMQRRTFFDKSNIASAIARKRGVDEIYD